MTITGKATTYTASGSDLPNVLQQTIFEIDEAAIQPNDVVVKTLATPINPSDIAQIFGGYNDVVPSTRLGSDTTPQKLSVGGNEGVFKVIQIGSNVKNYQVGDVVIPKLPGFGTWRTHAVVDITQDNELTPFIKVNELAVDQAATISINPSTAYQLLHQFIKDWKSGDWIIQNAGNSQASKYLTQLARLINVNVLSIIRDGKPQELYDDLYNLGATKILSESEFLHPEFKIEDVTNGKGNVRLALNSLGGKTVGGLVKSLSRNGVLVTYGVLGGGEITYDGRIQLFKNISTRAYWLTANTKANPQSKINTVEAVSKLFKEGRIKVVSYNTVKFDPTSDLKTTILSAINKSKTGKQVVIYE
ncbi:enoyl-[acyl-carrier protein] reductase [nadph, b-specific], putative [Candida dubliniensis CD36]|uniref:enoyl-[acyl-carrier-protein] reductase n=1 Tax=Candida dubliniensis (strain CD36 / ATCC MYA-646 / CBS 7987 / NCPF 3949 / NRRL Y-17841) TaxID=573826 RepID=B9W9H2_CANDC|nr:enoyl-[acyl-carrier protein] reductase [nadph, b-specific], putative [Candida dubliniensis CD36]CAX45455.1 enoyl-[acyl-carrier protein] reductase [nadph, b-specific], putative [Candida dubliniensis CD36]